jgi:4-hydroxybenzoyl-CoA thioesterase
MTYARTIPVEFNHCDPAGIVFYPRYFEMINSVIENFFREALDLPFARLMADGRGVPAVRIAVEFRAPSRLGETLDWTLEVARVGRSSATLGLVARGGGERRLEAEVTVVLASLEGGALAWPEEVRSRLGAAQGAPDDPA